VFTVVVTFAITVIHVQLVLEAETTLVKNFWTRAEPLVLEGVENKCFRRVTLLFSILRLQIIDGLSLEFRLLDYSWSVSHLNTEGHSGALVLYTLNVHFATQCVDQPVHYLKPTLLQVLILLLYMLNLSLGHSTTRVRD
jgi:hypothetical protein